MSLLRRALNQRFITSTGNPWVIPTNGSLGSIAGGGPLTPTTAMQMAAVFACVRIIAGAVSGLPLIAVDEKRKPVAQQPPIIADPFGGEVGPDPLLLSKRDGIRQLVVSMLTSGNAFNKALSERRGLPTMVQIISPGRVSINADNGSVKYEVDGEEADSVWHLRGLAWPGEVAGISPITYARRTIELGITSEEFGANFFRKGATMSGIIEVPGALDSAKARQLKQNFESSHSGVANSHAVGILTGGAAWKQITVSPEDAQFLGTLSAKTLDIAMLYGVPPHMLGQVDRTTSWGKGIEEQTLGFLKYSLRVWTDPIEDLFSRMLPEGMFARFDFDELLRPDTSTRYQTYQVARNAAILSPNEIRAKEGLDPVEGGDDIMAPLNSAHTTDPGYQLGESDLETPPGQPAPDAAPTN